MDKDRKKELIFLLCIFFFAFFLRVAYCLFFREEILYIQVNIFTDTQQYISVAQNFLDGKGIIISREIMAKITPVFPLFIAGVYSLFGENYWAIRLVQIIISSLSCILVYFLSKAVMDKNTARISAFMTAIYPFFIFFTGFVLTETLFVFLLLLSIYFLQLTKKVPSIKNVIITGVLFGISILCRPSTAVLILGFLISLLFPFLWVGWHNRFKIVGIMTAIAILTISPWSIRNFYHFRKFVPLTTMTGASFWEGNNPYSLGGPCQYWPEEVQKLSEVERDRYLTKATIRVIKNNPSRFIKLMGLKFIRFWNIIPNYEGFSSALYKLISLFSYVPVLITAIYGIFLTRRVWRNFLLFYILFLSFTFGHMLFVSSIRYRIPIMPFLIIFSAYGIIQIYQRIKSKAKKGALLG